MQAASILLTRVERFIENMWGHGIVDKEEAGELLQEVVNDRRALHRTHVVPQLSRSLEGMGTAEYAHAWARIRQLAKHHARTDLPRPVPRAAVPPVARSFSLDSRRRSPRARGAPEGSVELFGSPT